jgi:hypothetical protein
MPHDEQEYLKKAKLVRKRKTILARISSLPVDERFAFEKWYAENQRVKSPSDWPGFKKYFPDGVK